MNISDYLKESNKTQMEFARLLGVSQGTIGFWLHNKPPTVERAIQIEMLTEGAIRCEDLRPDLSEGFAYLRSRDFSNLAVSAHDLANARPVIRDAVLTDADPKNAGESSTGRKTNND